MNKDALVKLYKNTGDIYALYSVLNQMEVPQLHELANEFHPNPHGEYRMSTKRYLVKQIVWWIVKGKL